MDLFEPGSGSLVHDFNGDVAPTGLFWTVRLADEAVVVDRGGRRLTVDTQAPVIDVMAGSKTLPATVSFQMTWKARGRRRRLGQPAAPAGSAGAFTARLFTAARATGVFSGSAGTFTFQSQSARSVFAELGAERNGVLLSAAATRCLACAPAGTGDW